MHMGTNDSNSSRKNQDFRQKEAPSFLILHYKELFVSNLSALVLLSPKIEGYLPDKGVKIYMIVQIYMIRTDKACEPEWFDKILAWVYAARAESKLLENKTATIKIA